MKKFLKWFFGFAAVLFAVVVGLGWYGSTVEQGDGANSTSPEQRPPSAKMSPVKFIESVYRDSATLPRKKFQWRSYLSRDLQNVEPRIEYHGNFLTGIESGANPRNLKLKLNSQSETAAEVEANLEAEYEPNEFNSSRLLFQLVLEDGEWKIDDIVYTAHEPHLSYRDFEVANP